MMYGGQYALMGNQQAQDAPQHFPGLYPPQSIPQIGYVSPFRKSAMASSGQASRASHKMRPRRTTARKCKV